MSSTPYELLAKSRRAGRPSVTLEQHLLDTERAAARLFRDGSRWSASFLRFFKIPESELPRFILNLRIAALFHDIGKANGDFMRAMTQRDVRQTVRHEHLSVLVMHLPVVRDWLMRNPCIDHDAISAAVLSHHLKASNQGDWQLALLRSAPTVVLHLNHMEVRRSIAKIGELAHLDGAEKVAAQLCAQTAFPSSELSAAQASILGTRARAFRRDCKNSVSRRAFALALKAGVIAADSVASAMVREDINLDTWIEEVAHRTAIDGAAIERDIIAPRSAAVEKKTKSQFRPHQFQRGAAHIGDRALLLAACGAGKTLAAWYWAQARASERSIGRVIFLYPTRGTATEGFRDYVGWAPEGDSALVHGTSEYELEGMQANPPEALAGKTPFDESEARLFALGLWNKRYFSATVDQFLSFLEHRYESLCLLPALADSIVIIDEVHSFDQRMFTNLVAFLQHFDVPTLCMTATLPPSRQKQLLECGLRSYPNVEEREQLADLTKKENHPRYTLEACDGDEAAFAAAVAAYRSGKRVLWVVNVVKRCQQLAKRLSAELGIPVLAYHSRFKLADRTKAHQSTVAAFQQSSSAAIAVTTQVCEMSLDLDADLLITEHAPISSLVQRFGRANRHLARGFDFRATLLTYPPPNHLPYDRTELTASARFLSELRGDVSQAQLAAKLEELAIGEQQAPSDTSAFLWSGYYATPSEFRDGDDVAARCVLDTDVEEVVALHRRKKPIDGFLLSVPKKSVLLGEPNPGLPPFLGVALASNYDSHLGFQVEEVTS